MRCDKTGGSVHLEGMAESLGIHWAPKGSFGKIPVDAVFAGTDIRGKAWFVARVRHDGHYRPSFVYLRENEATFVYKEKVEQSSDYDLLCGRRLYWAFATMDSIPGNAYRCGLSEYAEALFIGRIHHEGTDVIGTVSSTDALLKAPYKDSQLVFKEYEILVEY